MKIYRPLLLILGVVGYMMFWVYSDSLNVMYPNQSNSFAQMFNGLLIVALLTGAFFPLKSLHGTPAKVGSGILILFSVLTILTGLIFAYNIKTEEFLFYFLLTALTTLVFTAALAAIGRFLIFRSDCDGKEIIQVLSIGLLGVLISYFFNTLFGSIESIYLWIGITILLFLSFYLIRRKGAFLVA